MLQKTENVQWAAVIWVKMAEVTGERLNNPSLRPKDAEEYHTFNLKVDGLH